MNKKDRAYHAGHKVSFAGDQWKIISWSNSYNSWCESSQRNRWMADSDIREAREQGERDYQAWKKDPERFSLPDHIPE